MAITTGVTLPTITEAELEAARQKQISKGGRPTRFSAEIVAEICVRLECGESLKAICSDKHMPSVSCLADWKRLIPAVSDALTRARRDGASALCDDGLSILDDLESKKDKDGNPIPLTMTDVRMAEMRARYRFDLAKVFDRGTFGDNQKITADINVQYTVGGIIELISGKTAPLVCLESETIEQALLCGEH